MINQTVKLSKLQAHNITVLRERKKWSKIELAEKCGVHRQTIYNVESGDELASYPVIRALCKAFDIEEHELFQINLDKK